MPYNVISSRKVAGKTRSKELSTPLSWTYSESWLRKDSVGGSPEKFSSWKLSNSHFLGVFLHKIDFPRQMVNYCLFIPYIFWKQLFQRLIWHIWIPSTCILWSVRFFVTFWDWTVSISWNLVITVFSSTVLHNYNDNNNNNFSFILAWGIHPPTAGLWRKLLPACSHFIFIFIRDHLVVWLFGCHQDKNDPTHRRMAVNCHLATTSIGETLFQTIVDQERGKIGPASLLHSWHWVLSTPER